MALRRFLHQDMESNLSSQLPMKLGNSQLHLKLGNSPFLIRLLACTMSSPEVNKIPGTGGTTHQLHLPKSSHMQGQQ